MTKEIQSEKERLVTSTSSPTNHEVTVYRLVNAPLAELGALLAAVEDKRVLGLAFVQVSRKSVPDTERCAAISARTTELENRGGK